MKSSVSGETDRAVTAFRKFNRMYTRMIGLLDEEIVNLGHTLAEARLMFELAHRGTAGPGELASELNMDAGYLSRIVHKLEQEGLLSRAASATDGRSAVLRLTRKGKTAFGKLDRKWTDQTERILGKLTPETRAGLIHSMETIGAALAPENGQKPFVLRSHRVGDMGWLVERQSKLYVQEYGWDGQYEGLAAKIVGEFILNFDAAREHCWIAEHNGERLGCIVLVKHPEREDTAKLRLLHVEASARGMGLGKALVAELLNFARAAGYKHVTLWTQSILHAAHRIYEQAGFKLAAEEPHHSFSKDLIGQTWGLDL